MEFCKWHLPGVFWFVWSLLWNLIGELMTILQGLGFGEWGRDQIYSGVNIWTCQRQRGGSLDKGDWVDFFFLKKKSIQTFLLNSPLHLLPRWPLQMLCLVTWENRWGCRMRKPKQWFCWNSTAKRPADKVQVCYPQERKSQRCKRNKSKGILSSS